MTAKHGSIAEWPISDFRSGVNRTNIETRPHSSASPSATTLTRNLSITQLINPESVADEACRFRPQVEVMKFYQH